MATSTDNAPQAGDSDANQTLEDALIKKGETEYLKMLSPQAKALTKAQITDLLNVKPNDQVGSKITVVTIAMILNMAKARMKAGKSVFPWDAMEGIEVPEEDNTGGGFW